MSAATLNLPTKACHNCRKRRWRCDRSLPSCQKCSSSGTECLGYGKLFKWNSGVASRGKMMGKSYDGRHGMEEEAKTLDAHALKCKSEHQPQQEHHLTQPHNDCAFAPTEHASHTAVAVHRPLVDPLVSDLDGHSRYYLHHFATQLCDVLVVYDTGQNPIRDLVPAVSAYPLLLHVMVANSAFHVFNISRNPMGPSAYQAENSLSAGNEMPLVTYNVGPLRSSYRDALIAKQQALALLAKSIVSVNEHNIDMILMTILLFVNYALVESGRDKWRVHMDGAWRLIQLLGEPPYLQKPMSKLRLTILSDFLVFYVLGSTFSFSAMPSFIPDTIDLNPILRYAETNNYLSCPGPLLRIMLESFALPDKTVSCTDEVYDNIQEQIEKLLHRALDFEPVPWSRSFEPASPYEDISQRIRIAAAHRSAVCIYLARVLPSNHPLIDPKSGTAIVYLTDLANDVVHQISHLKPGDALFKSICWPLFLAGAESRDPVQREWIMNTLDALYSTMFWGYLHTSKRVLEAIWKYLDQATDGEENCWVEEIKDLGNEILIA
ncbi:fungal-specific transcription factor domain-containing protein [Phaeosphaeria sp. MPI-PUGE-AT-0046c]|nr:fungal-specific transcription factor domain-containing protein [Phaeosphaeria sp. MPI-PUGE-AT-0046c]